MSASVKASIVIMVSAWRDEPGLRARVVHDANENSTEIVCSSAEEVAKVVLEVLHSWAGTDDRDVRDRGDARPPGDGE